MHDIDDALNKVDVQQDARGEQSGNGPARVHDLLASNQQFGNVKAAGLWIIYGFRPHDCALVAENRLLLSERCGILVVWWHRSASLSWPRTSQRTMSIPETRWRARALGFA
jgi:hypothetical protein